MSLILGTDVVLQFLKDDSYQTFVCSTECSIQTTVETVEVRTINGGKWKKKRGKSLTYKVSLNGLIDLDTAAPSTFWLLENFQLQLLPVPFRMVYTSESDLVKIMEGTALIETSELTSSSTSFANSSFDFVGDGAYTIVTASACEATILTASVSSGSPEQPGTTRVSYQVVNTARLEYSVDGGGREAIFDPGDSGEFFIPDLADGHHTIDLFAICVTGAEGDTNSIQFESVGGEPGDFCSPPDSLNVSAITNNSAFANWFASPVPGDGFYYELVNLNTSAVVQSDTQTATIKTFSGLTPGTPYRVRVRALCETGVSESAFITKDFTTTSVSCNVPGTPVMSAVTSTTATATWDPAVPAPASGYEWQVLSGVTVISFGSTASTSVNITGLPSGSSLTFQVRSSCGSSQYSSYISTNFETSAASGEVEWGFTRFPGVTTPVEFTVNKNAALEVQEFNTASSSFAFGGGDNIEAFLSGPSLVNNYYIRVTNDTTSTTIFEDTQTSGFGTGTIALTAGNAYTITAQITAT